MQKRNKYIIVIKNIYEWKIKNNLKQFKNLNNLKI